MTKTEAACNWWADKLRSCVNSGLTAEERSNPASSGYQLAEMLMTLNKPKVTEEQIEKFRANLAEQIAEHSPRNLDVDYRPDRFLGKALADAGIPIDMGALPIKTTMWLDGDKVEVSYGYGASLQTIWPVQSEGK